MYLKRTDRDGWASRPVRRFHFWASTKHDTAFVTYTRVPCVYLANQPWHIFLCSVFTDPHAAAGG